MECSFLRRSCLREWFVCGSCSDVDFEWCCVVQGVGCRCGGLCQSQPVDFVGSHVIWVEYIYTDQRSGSWPDHRKTVRSCQCNRKHGLSSPVGSGVSDTGVGICRGVQQRGGVGRNLYIWWHIRCSWRYGSQTENNCRCCFAACVWDTCWGSAAHLHNACNLGVRQHGGYHNCDACEWKRTSCRLWLCCKQDFCGRHRWSGKWFAVRNVVPEFVLPVRWCVWGGVDVWRRCLFLP